MAINNQPTIKPRTVTGIFTRYIAKTLPLAFDESMSYYECLCALLEYINQTIVTDINNVNDGLEELQTFYEELQTYVNDYFKNLDVQEEINNKLDDMVEAGTLQEIIADYLNSKAIFGYDNVADMKIATNLINGSYARTLGYYSKNDGGGSLYKIRTITNDDVVDERFIIALYDNTLIAELVINSDISPNQLGAYGDGIHNDSQAIQQAISSNYQVKFNKQEYLIDNTITIGPNKIIDFNWATLITSDGVTAFTINKNNGDNVFNYITLKNAFVNMENGGNFVEDVNNYNITYDNIRINRLHGSNFGFKITNGFNHRFLNVWINGMSDEAETTSGNNATGIIYDIDGNSTIQGITNVTNTAFKDCLIQTLYDGIRFDRSGASGSYDTTFMENMGFSRCEHCINANTNVLNDVNIQTIRCEWSNYALYINQNSSFIINDFFSNGTKKAIYNKGNIIFGGYARFDSQQNSNYYIIDYNNSRISFENCINFTNVGMVEFNPSITSEAIKQMDEVKVLTNSSQSISLNTFIKRHYKQTNYLNFTSITNLHDGMEFTLTNARDSGSVTLPDTTGLQPGETVKCYVINGAIKYIKLT